MNDYTNNYINGEEYQRIYCRVSSEPLRPDYQKRILKSDEMLCVSEFCKDYGWSTRKMNKWMGDHGLQYKRAKGTSWIPNNKWERMGLVIMRDNDYYGCCGTIYFSCINYWTPVARVLIDEMLREEGVLPVEERKVIASAGRGVVDRARTEGRGNRVTAKGIVERMTAKGIVDRVTADQDTMACRSTEANERMKCLEADAEAMINAMMSTGRRTSYA